MRYARMRSAGEQISPWKLTSTPSRSLSKLYRRRTEGAAVSDEQADQPPTGRARSLANLKRHPKGQTGNPSGRPKDLRKFGDILMKEFYKTVTASLGGKTVHKMQGEIVATRRRSLLTVFAISAVQGGRRSLDGLRASPCTRGGAPSCRS
jgi:hypothetical protein